VDAADLKVFEAVARLGGMNRAAEVLNTVQSNVTARIKRLEADLGVPLFDRHSRGVSLTAAGKRLIPYAHEVRKTLDDARRAVADNGEPRGQLLLGALETTAALRLSPHLAAFATRYPAVDFTLRTGTTQELIDMVLARDAEGAFVCGPVSHRDLGEEAVFQEELVVLSHPAQTDLDEILRTPDLRMVVLRAGCSYRQRMEEMLLHRGIVRIRVLEFGTLEAIFGCVAAGLGIAMLPKSLVEHAWKGGRVAVHALPEAEAAATTVFIRRRDTRPSTAMHAFVNLVRRANDDGAAAYHN